MTAMVDEVDEIESVADGESTEWLIRASGLRKKYCRDLRRSLWYSLRDVMGALGRDAGDAEALREHEFWAVDDVSFELRRGDSLGLLGRNGAGKSTLIKLVTGQRSLTAGRVEMRGRVVALTELGLGFDPVLTGRENAYVNAAVHGVSRRQFEKLIEKIIDFSELREFIDAAVHTYSSGMKARLGFSVATHLDPDILIVDEVLAVGDLEFRRKCVQHVLTYLKGGGAIVLVAHDPYLVQSICNRVMVLERGRVVFEGTGPEGVDFHFRLGHANMYAAAVEIGVDQEPGEVVPDLMENRPVVIDRISVVPVEGDALRTGHPVKVSIHYRSRVERDVGWGFSICTRDLQVNIASCAHGFDGGASRLRVGEHALSCVLPELALQAGVYAIRGGIGELHSQAGLAARGYEDSPLYFTVVAPKVTKTTNWQVMQADLVEMKVEWLP